MEVERKMTNAGGSLSLFSWISRTISPFHNGENLCQYNISLPVVSYPYLVNAQLPHKVKFPGDFKWIFFVILRRSQKRVEGSTTICHAFCINCASCGTTFKMNFTGEWSNWFSREKWEMKVIHSTAETFWHSCPFFKS